MTEAYVFEALRTPRGKGKKDGSLHEVKPITLLTGLLTELQARQGFDTAAVDDVVMGIVSPVGEQGSVLPKVAAIKAGWAFTTAGVQINRFCASGLEAVNLAAQKVCGADLIATLDGFTREDVDAFALESQRRATAARAAGYFKQSVVPVRDALGLVILEEDEFIKPQTTMEALAGLKPSFAQLGAMGFDGVALQRYPQVERIHHVHHAGNASGIVDGAAAVLIGNEAAAKSQHLTPRARIVATAVSGADPTIMLTGPVPATKKALARAGMTIDQIDLFEVNEAFAAVPMRFMRELGVPHEKVNVNGGAIALGHPLGATGAIRAATVVHALRRHQLKYGMVTMCVGMGQGAAGILERV